MNILEEFGVNLAEAKNDSCLVQTLPKVNCSHSLSRSLNKNFPNDFFILFLLKMLLLLLFFCFFFVFVFAPVKQLSCQSMAWFKLGLP